VPDAGFYDVMLNAALRGVNVRFMMTGVPDKKVPYWAAQAYFGRLLESGARVFLCEAGFTHQLEKLFVDDMTRCHEVTRDEVQAVARSARAGTMPWLVDGR